MSDLTLIPNSVSYQIKTHSKEINEKKDDREELLHFFVYKILDYSIVGHGTSLEKHNIYIKIACSCPTAHDLERFIWRIYWAGKKYKGDENQNGKFHPQNSKQRQIRIY